MDNKNKKDRLTPAHGAHGERGRKKSGKIGIIGTVIFVLLLAASSVMLWAFPTDTQSIQKENRAETMMPSFDLKTISSGEFTSGFEAYLNDHVGFRGVLQSTSKSIAARTGFDCGSGEFLSYKKDIGTGTQDDTLLMYHDHKLMEIFYEDKAVTKEYIAALKRIADAAGDGTDCYSMIVPTQLEFDDPYYSDVESSQKSAIDEIYKGAADSYTCVDAYGALEENTDKYIYFRSDHHWTQLGAYYAYLRYCEAAELDAVDIEDYEKKIFESADGNTDMLGSLYQYTGYGKMKEMPDKIEWYNTDPDENVTISCKGRDGTRLASYDGVLFDRGVDEPTYSFYLGGDHHYIKLENKNAQTDRTLFMIRDSYANAFMPWLINNYSAIIAYDPRSNLEELPELIAGENITDVLVMNYIFSSGFEDYCNALIAAADKLEKSRSGVAAGEDETVAYHDDVLVEIFHDNEPNCTGYTDGLAEAAEALPEGAGRYIMIAPTYAAYDDALVTGDRSRQQSVINRVYSALDDKYECIDLFGVLDSHKDEYIYFHTDHHWTQLGAYYAYTEYCKAAGLSPVDIGDYKKQVTKSMLGSLYKQKPEKAVRENPDYIEWYDTDPDEQVKFTPLTVENGELVEYKAKMFWTDMEDMQYSFYLGGDHKFIKLENTALNNGKTLLIAHDSYANALLPWLINNYQTIISYDPLSTLDVLSDLLDGEEIDDFLVINYISSIVSERYAVDTDIMAREFKEAWPQE